ncbi:AP2/B3-like transcriptional factor family protein [Striga asiatica]|uniref:AP2/B3-like transcriptional factor family protein n=1 Tax=Striga asiatica TaxID=4170 RepID=A0A5A7PH71_STRAF|nr:AP2/B3-like transcriptional factor family protein [Striga asiatica]
MAAEKSRIDRPFACVGKTRKWKAVFQVRRQSGKNEHWYVCVIQLFVFMYYFVIKIQKLPDSLNHQYSHRTPVECTLTTREGRRYIVTLRGNRFRVFFDEGWRDFVHGEDIMVDNCLWFNRTSFTDFIVTVHGEDQVERDLRYRYTLEIKKSHVERARLPIPINFWRDYILTDPTDTFRAILEFEGRTYELQIDAEDFVDATQMVEGDTWQFTLTPYFCVRFEVGQKRCWRGRKWIGGLKHEGSFLWDDDSNWYFSSRGSAQTYCNTQSTAEGFSNKWLPPVEESFCSILLHYIQSEGLNSEFDILMAFDRIYRSVFDIHAKTVYLHEDDREEALEVWALANHYCSNNPEPLWETLKIIFEPLGIDPYPGEMRARDERNLRKLDQVIREYWAEERRMAAQRRRRGN